MPKPSAGLVFCDHTLSLSSCLGRAQRPLQQYDHNTPIRTAFDHAQAECRTPFDLVPHGNFFNNLPPAPEAAVEAMPEQDGSIAWDRKIIEHNRQLLESGHSMVRSLTTGPLTTK